MYRRCCKSETCHRWSCRSRRTSPREPIPADRSPSRKEGRLSTVAKAPARTRNTNSRKSPQGVRLRLCGLRLCGCCTPFG
eukprot:14112581-Alexandrium_andersonii.AAC.1